MKRWARRRVCSVVIHSRACCVEMNSAAGREPSGFVGSRASRVIRSAMIGLPSIDCPIVSSLTGERERLGEQAVELGRGQAES